MLSRKAIFEIVEPDNGKNKISRIFDLLITTLIFASVVIVFASTFKLSCRIHRFLAIMEGIASIVFTIEYFLRIWTADFLYPKASRGAAIAKYILSPMAIIDLVAVLPFWLPMLLPGTMLGLRALRLVRLLRIFKLNRYFDAVKSLGEVIKLKKRELLGSMFFVAILMLISSLLMYSAEHEVQPEVFRNAFSGLWWAVATLTTVGYGDIYPITAAGRLIGAFIAFSGLAAVAIPTGIISSGLMESLSRGEKDSEKAPPPPPPPADEGAHRKRLAKEQLDKIASALEALDKLESD